MRIYVPSMSRADHRLASGPAAQMPDMLVHYVVPEAQTHLYVDALRQHGLMRNTFVIPCPERGIAATRHFIARHAREAGSPHLCMIDDDVGFLIRRAEDTWQLRAQTPEETVQMMGWIDAELDRTEHVSVSAREGNNRAGIGSVETLVDRNTRTLRVLAYQTEALLAAEHGRVDVMEDFDVSLQILRAGGSNAVSFWYAQGQRMTNEQGGCSEYRSHEVHEASARRLAELHPGLVRLRQKVNKTDREGFGTRTEVTISWKRAWEQGQSRAS